MAVAFRGAGAWVFSANSAIAGPTLTPVKNAATVNGDLLLLISECEKTGAFITAAPTGWTFFMSRTSAYAPGTGGQIYAYVRIADGTANDAPSVVWNNLTTGTSGSLAGAGIISYSGAQAVLDGAVVVSDLSAQTTSSVISPCTTGTDGSLAVGVAMKLLESSGQTSTVTPFTERADNQSTNATGHTIEVCDTVVATAGSSGAATVTWSVTTSARAFAVSFAMKAVPPPAALLPQQHHRRPAVTPARLSHGRF